MLDGVWRGLPKEKVVGERGKEGPKETGGGERGKVDEQTLRISTMPCALGPRDPVPP